MHITRRIRHASGRYMLVACPYSSSRKRLTDANVSVAFGDVMSIVPRATRMPDGFTAGLPVLSGQKVISVAGLKGLAEFNRDDKPVAASLESLAAFVREWARDAES